MRHDGSDGMGWDGMGWNRIEWQRMIWDGMGWHKMGWNGRDGILSSCQLQLHQSIIDVCEIL